MFKYTQGFAVKKNGSTVAHIAIGQKRKDEIVFDHVHAWATSSDAIAFSDLLRNEFPDSHYVTRADSCEDFIHEGAYEKCQKKAKKVAVKHRLSFQEIKDSLNDRAGRTQYVGSKKSDYLGRIYEKGFEVISKNPQQFPALYPDGRVTLLHRPDLGEFYIGDWVRSEIAARPQGDYARLQASKASPEQLWTFTSWSHELSKKLFELELDRFHIRIRKSSDDEKAFQHMCKQYGPMLNRMRDELGDWKSLGMTIGETCSRL
jgi:DNA relaxase NicK